MALWSMRETNCMVKIPLKNSKGTLTLTQTLQGMVSLDSAKRKSCLRRFKLNKGFKRLVIPTWRLRLEDLTHAPFEKAVRDELTQYFEANWGTSTTRGYDWEAMKVVIRGLCMQTTYGVRHQLEKDVLDYKAKLRDLEKCIPTQPQRKEE
ncbi:hypothetical protein NDU88_009744 [Pleurodeles waltl]|uniref:Uncharacterized protein n=1 Tax=Pleurodeles waltl TaxID=8319 RepID=A0AAV7RXG2_PLEWA|nr:hypothetical protein NDU88_009744 [Pleurodeles waltl]